MVRIPACHAGGREFESRPPRHFDLLAQLVEQFPFKEWVEGSHLVLAKNEDNWQKAPIGGVIYDTTYVD